MGKLLYSETRENGNCDCVHEDTTQLQNTLTENVPCPCPLNGKVTDNRGLRERYGEQYRNADGRVNRRSSRARISECQEYTFFYNRAKKNGLINPLPPYTECPSYGWLVPQGSNLDFSMNNIVYMGASPDYNPGPCGSSYGCFVTPMAFCQLWSIRTQGAGGTENHLLGMLARLKYNVPNINCGPTQPMAVPMARIGRGLSDNRMNKYKGLRG